MEYVIANENPITLIKTWLGWRIKTMQHKSRHLNNDTLYGEEH